MEAVGGTTINEAVAQKKMGAGLPAPIFFVYDSGNLEKPGHQIVPDHPGPKPGIHPIQCATVSGNHFA